MPGASAIGAPSAVVNVVGASSAGFCHRPRSTDPSLNSQASPSPTGSASGTTAPVTSRWPLSR